VLAGLKRVSVKRYGQKSRPEENVRAIEVVRRESVWEKGLDRKRVRKKH